MGGRPGKGVGYLILLLLVCGLAGGAIGDAIGDSLKNLSFLKNYMTIGMTQPIILNLKLITLTFGISFRVNLISLLGMMLGYFIYKKM